MVIWKSSSKLSFARALHLGQLVEPTKDKMDLSLGILAALLQLSSHSHQKGPKNRKHNYSYCAMEIGHKILLRNMQSVGSELIVSNVTFQLLTNWVERISLPQNSYSLLQAAFVHNNKGTHPNEELVHLRVLRFLLQLDIV